MPPRKAKAIADLSRGEKVCAFIERYCRIPEGSKVGQPLKLDRFQRRFILAVFDNKKGTRRAYLSMARKNGKTCLIAAILLAFLVGPEAVENSQIISGAMSRDQAGLVFKLALKMVNLDPELRRVVREVVSTKTLHGLPMNVEYRAISSESSTAHGLSPILAILDEVGQVRGPHSDFVEAIETSQGAHDDPLLIAISTQAPSDGDLFSIWLDDAERSGDPTIVSQVHAAPADAKLDDKSAWEAANPGLGKFRSLADIEAQAVAAMRLPSKENGFRNLCLNQRVSRFTPFISPRVWGLGGEAVDLEVFKRSPVYGGLDLSLTTDLTSLVLIAEDQGEWHVLPIFWTPESTLVERARRDRAPYDAWARDGFMKATPGPAVEYSFVARDIAELVQGMDLRMINFDRHRMALLAAELERIDVQLPFTAFGQGFVSMAPALDALEVAFLHGRIRHGAHPVLTMCAANCVIAKDAAGNRKLDKARSTGRIDGMVSLVMAYGAATGGLAEVKPEPTYQMLIL